ncbi:retrovirus-related pol polyprotein from transposon TNT 1-94 [Tanacetum coccineum]
MPTSYSTKTQLHPPDTKAKRPSLAGQPLEQVQNHDESNVYDNVRRHSEQPESINDTYVLEKDDSNVTPDSSNICTNDNQVDQNAAECVDERAALANLIANLTLDTEENKTILKQLKKANASLTQELEKCKTNLDETIIDYEILQTKLNETLGLLALKDIEIKEGLKTKAYEISVLNQKHDELVKKSLLTKSQLEGYLKENTKVISDLKVKEEKDIDKMIEMDKQLKFLNEIVILKKAQSEKPYVNARTKKPNVVPISASKPKRKANKSVATPHKKTVASDTTIQKSKSYYKELYENTNQEWKWWIAKRCPSGYTWTQKPLRTKKIWMPKIRKADESTSISPTIDIVSRITNIVQLILFIVDSGCTKHMTGNLKLLCNFVEKFLGTVRFGNDQFAPILGYGDLIQGNVTIKRVYYVEGLNHNLFSVGQFCDADLEVAFRKSTCFVRDLQGNDLLTGSRGSDLYTISLQETTSSTPICFMAKASPTQAWLWHRRLSHLNFDYITLLSKKDVVTGLPKLTYVKDQLCSSCEMSKAKRSSFKSKAVPSSKGRLNLLHMDLCGPMRVASINGKKYILVIVDDYSRYTWTLFLRSKDETPEVLKDFLTMIQRNLQAQVITVRTDRGTEFLNKTLHAYFKEEGIEHQTSTPRTPEQNGVVERRNRTLVEAARTMLSASKLPLSFWAEAVATACYTQNRSIIISTHGKTAYHIINDRKPLIKHLHIFGCICYITRWENIEKMKKKKGYHVSCCSLGRLLGFSWRHAATSLFHSSRWKWEKRHFLMGPEGRRFTLLSRKGSLIQIIQKKILPSKECFVWIKASSVSLIYVDDIIFGSTNPKYSKRFEKLMHSRFEMSLMGEMKFFLGLQIHQSPKAIFRRWIMPDALILGKALLEGYSSLVLYCMRDVKETINYTAMSFCKAEYVVLSARKLCSSIVDDGTQLRRNEYPNLADMFTKALPEDRFKYPCKKDGSRCLTPADWRF